MSGSSISSPMSAGYGALSALHSASEAFIGEAVEIGRYIVSHLEIASVKSLDMYEGLSGIVLFLAHLSRLDPSMAGHSRSLAQVLQRALAEGTLPPGGAFHGSGAVTWSLLHLWSITGEDSYIAAIIESLESISQQVKSDRTFDIISGSAGLIYILLEIYRVTSSPIALQIACQAADHLLLNRQLLHHGFGWLTISRKHLVGFAHGSAGISCSLLNLAAVSGNNEYLDAASHALEYERAVYSINAGATVNTDLKSREDKALASSWCHGAAGIAVSRLRFPSSFIGVVENREIELALGNLSLAENVSDCLCHGTLGHVDVLLTAACKTGRPSFQQLALQMAMNALTKSKENGTWIVSPSRRTRDVIGFMTGLAGIGFTLLRAARPSSYPSLLSLDPIRPVERFL
jgi:lantibiotic modifying enzyme